MEEQARLRVVEPAEEADAFEPFFRSVYPGLCRALYLLTGDAFEAEELAQETLTRVLERWERVQTMESPAGYTYRTALNLNRKRVRRAAVRARRVFASIPAEDHSTAVGDQHDVHRALAKLSPTQREALILIDWLEMDTEQAGRVLGIEPGSVRVRLHRARATLRTELGGTR